MVGTGPVNQDIYDSLLLLQHRGQDATGIATAEPSGVLHIFKARGMVREAACTRDQCRCSATSASGTCATPRRAPRRARRRRSPSTSTRLYGITLIHNGNLTNTRELTADMAQRDRRHLNSSSDTELLVNVLAHELQATASTVDLDPERIFAAVSRVHERVEGAYAAIAVIAGYGPFAFRDPFGIRPLILGHRKAADGRDEWVVASESLVLENADYEVVRDVDPGEAVFIDNDGAAVHAARADHTGASALQVEAVHSSRPNSEPLRSEPASEAPSRLAPCQRLPLSSHRSSRQCSKFA